MLVLCRTFKDALKKNCVNNERNLIINSILDILDCLSLVFEMIWRGLGNVGFGHM